MDITIPGRGIYSVKHLIDGVSDQLWALRDTGLAIHWITADTRGRQAALDSELGWPAARITTSLPQGEAAQKAAFIRDLGAECVVAIGSGANDVAMLREAALGIAVLGPEGLAVEAILAADLVAPDIHAALALLQDPARLVATLRQ
jgi:P-type E1-E2 ATPase